MESGARLASEIAAGWGLTAVRVVDERVSYPTRVVSIIAADEGAFVAKVFTDLDTTAVASSLDVLIGVRAAGFSHAPAVRLTGSGDPVGMTHAGPTVLMEYIPVQLDNSDSNMWADIASAVASLNMLQCTRAFTIPIAAALRDQVAIPPSDEYASGITALVRRVHPLASLPSDGVVHGEANPSNAARRASGDLALLDWDQAGMAPSALDYGYPLITCFISESLNVDEAAIGDFYDAYRSHGRTVDSRLAIDAALFHALRYMWFANTPVRWERIQFALRHEDDLRSLIGRAHHSPRRRSRPVLIAVARRARRRGLNQRAAPIIQVSGGAPAAHPAIDIS